MTYLKARLSPQVSSLQLLILNAVLLESEEKGRKRVGSRMLWGQGRARLQREVYSLRSSQKEQERKGMADLLRPQGKQADVGTQD